MEDDQLFNENEFSLFEEPAGFRPSTPPPTLQEFARESEYVEPGTPSVLEVQLVGKHSLWGHWLWNAGRSMAHYIDRNKSLVKGKNVLELGAAAAVPSLTAALNGAKRVVITDYPDLDLLKALRVSAEKNVGAQLQSGAVKIVGYLWGDDASDVLGALDEGERFDLIILADLVFNHNQHRQLLSSIERTLAPNGIVLCSFSHHVPKRAPQDLAFFELAQAPPFDFEVEHLFDEKWNPMFPNDTGDLEMRSTVYFYSLKLPQQ
ncbi:putative methyltransferase-domain-containing protein [Cladochytrium replicatum]|nr:putative methyltransferase-domain-containing protein [Cladochytrium replicatum]